MTLFLSGAILASMLIGLYAVFGLIKQRLYINEEGKPDVLTPAALDAIDREKNPLVVFDKLTYYQRDDTEPFFERSGRLVFANMTGKVRNQGTKVLRNVVVEVRFLNALNQILDFQTHRIGTLRPNDVRPFWAQARHYDNLLNITEAEVITRWEGQ